MGVQSGGVVGSSQMSPSRFNMTAGCMRRVLPRGSPVTARTCCSNCDVSQASMVW